MKNYIELKYHKNSKHEIVFENLDEVKENDNVVLRLQEGNLTPLLYLNDILVAEDIRLNNLFIPKLCHNWNILSDIDDIMHMRVNKIFTIDNTDISKLEPENIIKNILPKWNIPADSAVLFLNMNDFDKYAKDYDTYFTYPNFTSEEGCLDRDYFSIRNHKNISIILPQLHAEDKSCKDHIDNINKVCKELKEKYGIERIELFVSHCFLHISEQLISYFKCYLPNKTCIWANENFHRIKKICYDFDRELSYIDKITTTNSTGVLKVQKGDRLEVVDCVDFLTYDN